MSLVSPWVEAPLASQCPRRPSPWATRAASALRCGPARRPQDTPKGQLRRLQGWRQAQDLMDSPEDADLFHSEEIKVIASGTIDSPYLLLKSSRSHTPPRALFLLIKKWKSPLSSSNLCLITDVRKSPRGGRNSLRLTSLRKRQR